MLNNHSLPISRGMRLASPTLLVTIPVSDMMLTMKNTQVTVQLSLFTMHRNAQSMKRCTKDKPLFLKTLLL
jgi:uncharacterized caspase-like protein